MQYASWWPRSNDGLVSKAFASVTNKLVDKFCFNFVLRNSWLYHPNYTSESLFGDVAGHLQLLDFFRLLDPTELMHQRRCSLHNMQGVLLLAGLDKACISCFYHYSGPQVLVGIQVNALREVDHRIENGIKGRKPLNCFNSWGCMCLLFGVFMSFPYRDVVVGLSEK